MATKIPGEDENSENADTGAVGGATVDVAKQMVGQNMMPLILTSPPFLSAPGEPSVPRDT